MLVKVISNKTVGYDKEAVLTLVMADRGKEQFLYRIIGVIEGFSQGKGRHQRVDKDTGLAVDTQWTKFMGDFMAQKPGGEVFEAATAFIPDYVSGQFVTALKDDGQISIEFAYDIFARYNKDTATSYEYIAVPVRKAGEERTVTKLATAFQPMPGQAALASPEAQKGGEKAKK